MAELTVSTTARPGVPDDTGVPARVSDRGYGPLPTLVEPAVQPAVSCPRDEALVVVEHPLIEDLAAYHRAGWASAPLAPLLREGAARRLYQAAESLPDSFGLGLFDAWRPLELQAALYQRAYRDVSLPAGFVQPPSADPATPPPHLTGGTVDVTLTWQGRPLELGTAFDDFTALARPAAFESSPGPVRDLRRLLFWTLRGAGFVILDCEWWHFEYGTRRWAAITGSPPLYGPATPLP